MKRSKHKASNKSKRSRGRIVKPLGIQFTIETLPGIIQFNNQLAQKLADAKISRDRAGAFNGIINNQIHALVGLAPRPAINVVRQVLVAPSDLKEYSREEQELLVRAVKIIESKAATSTK